MRNIFLILLSFFASGIYAATPRKTCIDQNWRFRLGDAVAAVSSPSITESWRKLDLPHDWSVETEAAQLAGGTVVGPFSTNSVGGRQTGFTVGGEGWYARNIHIDNIADSRYELYFEGAYNQADVYVNGQHAGENVYGYVSFRIDATPLLHDGDNMVLVRVRNEGNNSRWYAGSGIYRHVWLIRTPLVFADEWDTYAQTEGENVNVQTKVINHSSKAHKTTVSVDIFNSKGLLVAHEKTTVKVAAGASQDVSISLHVANPDIWDPSSPVLYKAVVKVKQGKSTDRIEKKFGFRTIDFSAENGFLLNGQPTLLQGGCIHHDNGLLGAAAYNRAETKKLTLLQQQGYNAIRCSHNIPSEHFLDVCDSIGMLVIDEAFDQWLKRKNPDDYHRFFPEHSTQDVQTMVRRDRNHPCIIMWSIGNEIPGRIEPSGMEAARCLREAVRQYDTTRPVTAAICSWDEGDEWNAASQNWDSQDNKAFQSLDVGGYNYLFDKYVRDHVTHPDRVMFGAESYPKEASQNWDLVESQPYVIGDFVWTAMDYLGEAGIGSASIRDKGYQSMFQNWPWYNGWCGDIDLIGQKKPQSYYRDVIWHRAPVTMAVEEFVPEGKHMSVSRWGWQLEEQSWTFPDIQEGTLLNVNIYSRAPRVRLYLNGVNMGEAVPSRTYHAGFKVPYKKGTLRAVNLDEFGNVRLGEDFTLHTTGSPASIRLIADRTAINADGQDLSYVTIELIDAQGKVITSNHSLKVNISASGTGGSLLACGNGSNLDMESFRSTSPRLFRGRALAIIKATTTPGPVTLNVTADNLPPATLTISSH